MAHLGLAGSFTTMLSSASSTRCDFTVLPSDHLSVTGTLHWTGGWVTPYGVARDCVSRTPPSAGTTRTYGTPGWSRNVVIAADTFVLLARSSARHRSLAVALPHPCSFK